MYWLSVDGKQCADNRWDNFFFRPCFTFLLLAAKNPSCRWAKTSPIFFLVHLPWKMLHHCLVSHCLHLLDSCYLATFLSLPLPSNCNNYLVPFFSTWSSLLHLNLAQDNHFPAPRFLWPLTSALWAQSALRFLWPQHWELLTLIYSRDNEKRQG